MANFVAHAFSALSISEKTIQKYPLITARNAAKHVLNEYLDGCCFSCIDHTDIVKKGGCPMYNQHLLQQETESRG